mgnify:CR=1 FL=1
MSINSNNGKKNRKISNMDDFDFELIYSHDIDKLKEIDNCNNKISDISTTISEGMKDIEYSNSNNNLELKLESDKNPLFNKAYISLDSKNYFRKSDPKESEELIKKFKIKYQKIKLSQKLKELSELIREKIYEILFPNTKKTFFSICLESSKFLDKSDCLNKIRIEKNLNFFFTNQKKYHDETIFLDNIFINNCGPILGHVYNRLSKFKIKSENSFVNAINTIINKKVNVKNDFDSHFIGKNVKFENLEKIKYFRKIKKKFIIQPEIIYLINLFHPVKKIIIDINIKEKEYSLQFFHFFVLCIFTIPYIMKDINSIKFTAFNEALLKDRIEVNEEKLNHDKIFSYKKNKTPKIISKKEKINTDENESFLSNYKLIEVKNKIPKNWYTFERKTANQMSYGNLQDLIEKPIQSNNTNLNIIKNKSSQINVERKFIQNWFMFQEEASTSLDNTAVVCKILEMIIIIFLSFDKFEKIESFELILVDSLYSELSNYFKNRFKTKVDNFHILNVVYNKLIGVGKLYLEINSFDLITFNELLNIIYNSKATTLQLSLFTKEIMYSSPYLYKIYRQTIKRKLIKEEIYDKSKKRKIKINEIYFKSIYHHFVKNLNSLFEILKIKKLSKFDIILNVPPQILNDDKYIIVIIKFIINIFILFFYDENSLMNELSVISPSLIINGAKYLFMDEFLQNNNIKNENLLILDIRLKFYNIRSLHKFIPQKLKILNIGDFDAFSFRHFVDNITKYNFVKNTSLQQLSIKLNNNILILDEEIRLILAKLFNINIPNLLLYLYTNIKIDYYEYHEILKLLQYNWIYNYYLSFNNESKPIIKQNYGKINQLIHIIPKEPGYSKMGNVLDYLEGKKVKQPPSFLDIYYCIKKIIYRVNQGKVIDFYSLKIITSNIFIFLYLSKKPVVKFFEKEN